MPTTVSTYLSTPQAARAIGVSVSTIKRWVDEGLLPAHKTAGGHRKLLRAEVLALARQGKLPQVDSSDLFLATKRRQPIDEPSLVESLYQVLLDGDLDALRNLVRRAYRSGLPIERLADKVLAPVMRQIGHEWESARIDVWQEHRS